MSTPIFAARAFIWSLVADQRGLDEALERGFNGALHGDVRQRPHDRGGDSGQDLCSAQ